MISKILYSIAGKERSDEIDSILMELSDSKYVTDNNTKKLLEKAYATGQHGNYPTASAYNGILTKVDAVESIAELKVAVDEFLAKQKMSYIRTMFTTMSNKTDDPTKLLDMFSVFIDGEGRQTDTYDFSAYKQILYTELQKQARINGFMSGVEKLDEVTNGFQPGTVATIAAFTGEGKSTLLNSIIYKNVLEGKKVVLFSLELPVEQVWMLFEARYMKEHMSRDYTTQQFIQRTISADDELEEIKKNENYFQEKFKNLKVLDENVLSKSIISDFKKISDMYRILEAELGGLDIVAYDHIGQIELLFPEMGNIAVRNITSATKTYYNKEEVHPCTIMCVQVNREGNKRARQRNGSYDLQAIGDLNEVERSSTYCVFLYTDNDLKVQQYTWISMLKHRLGAVIPQPFQTRFLPSCITVGDFGTDDKSKENGFNSSYSDDFSNIKQSVDFDSFNFQSISIETPSFDSVGFETISTTNETSQDSVGVFDGGTNDDDVDPLSGGFFTVSNVSDLPF